MFFGIIGCPSKYSVSTVGTPDVITKPGTDTSEPLTEPTIGDESNNSGAVPEPTTLILLGAGLVGLGVLGRKRFKK